MDEQLCMLVDIFEPQEILPLLKQSIPVSVTDLNISGYADYFFSSCDGHIIQAERKQNGELLSNLMRVEEQLSRQYNQPAENILIIEGFIIPSQKG